MGTIATSDFVASLGELFNEAAHGPPAGQGSWFTSPAPGAGLLGTLAQLDAAAASWRPPGLRNSIVAHAAHLRFSLDVFNRAARGENAYATADWASSWKSQELDAAGWTRLREDLADQLRRAAEAVAACPAWDDRYVRTGTMAQPAHLAYHLGAIRQLAALAAARSG